MTGDNLSERQKKLMVWRDYFKMLRDGISSQGSDKATKTRLWLDVAITEIEGDVLHLESGQPEYCRWEEVPDLAEMEGNWDVREL